jgi:NADP-dependent 3-hydroxy acid dehydrogenase YdfG
MNTSPEKTVVVVGASSGVGRAVAIRFLTEGWQVALVGRRADALAETVAQAPATTAGSAATFPCDIGQPEAVDAMALAVLSRFTRVDVLVNCAGTNIARRSWKELSRPDYQSLFATNLHGFVYCVQAFLPGFRTQSSGTVININSEAGRIANTKAGAAYVATKFALAGLIQSLNAEERANGIRACSIFPGDINTPLLDRRPQPPPPEARVHMLQPEDVAACVWLAASLPSRAVVEELIVRPRI